MSSGDIRIPITAHVLAMPFPGRGHVNPMLNLCKLLASQSPQILITFVVTNEWRSFLDSEILPPNIHFGTIPQVIPSEVGRASDFPGFIEAVSTKMEAPFEQLLDRLEPPPTAIVHDTFLMWVTGVGSRRNIPVASLFTMPASVFTVFFHFDLLVQNGHFPIALPERGNQPVDYIPGLPATTIGDLPTIFDGDGRKTLHRAVQAASSTVKAQYLLFTSVHELEPQVIDALKSEFSHPIYPIGPMLPYHSLDKPHDPDQNYFHWLDSQPKSSVLYVSMGSFLSVSSAQIDEIVAGIRDSGVRYLWVTRGDTSAFGGAAASGGKMGCLVPWCEQLKVLCHPSIGGFWTHCGWNSTSEGVFAGVPMLTFPIFWDQIPNSKMIVDDWKIGRRVRKSGAMDDKWVTREEIAGIVKEFMDLGSKEREGMVRRARRLQEVLRGAISDGGSAASNLNAFFQEVTLVKATAINAQTY
ncbi:hypothetical protein Dimus_020503 [Dionaea muscipula]